MISLSVIIPCYNAKDLVADAIQSACEIDASREVIVVDDGSSDGSDEVIKSFGNRIRSYFGPNRGACAARNLGLQMALGQFVMFLDADDILNPSKVVSLLATARRSIDKTFYSNYTFQKTDGTTVAHRQPPSAVDPVVAVLENPRMGISSPLHSIASLRQIGGFTESLNGSQELDLHLRLAAAGQTFVHWDETTYTVRQQVESVSSDYVKTAREQLKFLPQLIDSLRERADWHEVRAIAFAKFTACQARACFQRGDAEVGDAFWQLSRSAHPSAAYAESYSLSTRWMCHLLGPRLTEKLVGAKRALSRRNR